MTATPSVFIKRDGRRQPFKVLKIYDGILNAMLTAVMADEQPVDRMLAQSLVDEIVSHYADKTEVGAEELYETILQVLLAHNLYTIMGNFIDYREDRDARRTANSKLMKSIGKIVQETTRDNANVGTGPQAKMLQIGSESSKLFNLNNMPKAMAKAHKDGDTHFHDLDYMEKTINCLQVPLERLLTEGFSNGRGYIRPPARINSAAALTAIIIQATQNDMFGGISVPYFDTTLSKFVPELYEHLHFLTNSESVTPAAIEACGAIRKDVFQAMEGLVYNLNSMHSRAGAQVPFSSINMGTGTSLSERLVIEQMLKAYKAGLGRGETPLFPNVIFRVKDGNNLNPGDPNYDMFELACEVAANRMNPTFSNMDMSINKPYGDLVSLMGCRTRVIGNRNGPAVAEGRGNIGFATMNLVRAGIEGKADKRKVYKRVDRMLAQAEEHLLYRYKVASKLKGRDLPFVVGDSLYVGSEALGPNDSIEPMLKQGTYSIGFLGLAETMQLMYGKHHGESDAVWEEAYALIEYIANAVKEMSDRNNLNFTTFATPAEGLSGRFPILDRERYGAIANITDKGYYTNSFHLPVDYVTSIKHKIDCEAPFHKLCDAGHISYVELLEAPIHNPKAIEDIVRYAFSKDMGYLGINFPIDECPACGFRGTILDDCQCGNHTSNIIRIRRITGYLSTLDRFGDGKQAEAKARTAHK